jgi:decaprenylphospho-beta-D-ribofuranose 2-oxidase
MPAPDAGAAPRRLFSGWGRTVPTWAEGHQVRDAKELPELVGSRPPRGLIARGLGRSYGDAAQCAGGEVLEFRPLRGLRSLDLETGVVSAWAGTSFDELMRWLVPLGWFVPVTPGTRFVTVGGAIAADIHGKNHHSAGSFVDHVDEITLQLADGSVVDVSRVNDPDLFWATAGGMGLTGLVVSATFRMKAVATSRLAVDTERTPDLDTLMARMIDSDDHHDYSVAWIDLTTTGAAMGRGILDQGRFAEVDELPPSLADEPLAFAPRVMAPAPPWAPPHLLNPLTVRAFNEFWFRVQSPAQRREGAIQSITQFFHPLDLVEGWNRIYGRHGFLQWQLIVPYGEEATLRHVVEQLSSNKVTSFLAVLKRFGPANPGPLSFPTEGWTLALDIPGGIPGLGPLLDRLDERVAEVGGRIYLAKDSRLRPELVPVMYPRLDDWRAVRERVDPHRVFQSDLGRRLAL